MRSPSLSKQEKAVTDTLVDTREPTHHNTLRVLQLPHSKLAPHHRTNFHARHKAAGKRAPKFPSVNCWEKGAVCGVVSNSLFCW